MEGAGVKFIGQREGELEEGAGVLFTRKTPITNPLQNLVQYGLQLRGQHGIGSASVS